MFKVNNRNSRKRYEIFSKLTTQTPKQQHWHLSWLDVFFFLNITYSLGARDGFIQPFSTKGLTALVCKSGKMD